MFTGIVELGKVVKKETTGDGFRLTVDIGKLASEIKAGDSIAVNGTCLTVTKKNNNSVSFDVVFETVKRTNLGDFKTGEAVNIEPAIRAGQPFGGHFVQGHIDGIGVISKKETKKTGAVIEIAVPPEFTNLMIEKGSIAVDGCSLTLMDIKKDRFSIALIPFTLQHTTFGEKKKGDQVNVELDIMGKWVNKLLAKMGKSDLTLEQLAGEGF
ncbi:MAG: riboflavin synthase [Planctomycetota bacterium]